MTEDALGALRDLRQDAPWNLRDLVATAAAILGSAGVRPVNAAASDLPSERTVRFYVSRGLTAPPDGRGPAATYSYRHLLQVLTVKLRQMEGAPLDVIAREMSEMTGDVLERRVAAALGPTPAQGTPWRVGSAGRSFQARMRVAPEREGDRPAEPADAWRRFPIGPGAELHLSLDHPLSANPDRSSEIVEGVRSALARLVARAAEAR